VGRKERGGGDGVHLLIAKEVTLRKAGGKRKQKTKNYNRLGGGGPLYHASGDRGA